MKKSKILGVVAAAAMAAMTFASCSSSGSSSSSSASSASASSEASSATSSAASVNLNISAAASLTDVIKKVEAAYTKANSNVTFTNSFGSSGTLVKQIQNGADADVFFSAAESNMDTLAKASLITDSTRKDVVKNTLEFIIPSDAKEITSLNDLTTSRFKQIAIGNPDSVPAGKYAQKMLTEQKMYDKLKSKFVQGTDVRAVLNYVETGNAEGGFVYATDAKTSTKVKSGFTIPDAWQPKIIYPAAVIKASKSQDAAKAFVDYLSESDSQTIFQSYGFSSVK